MISLLFEVFIAPIAISVILILFKYWLDNNEE
ncbi:type I toxin-antitoxin system Fst family toxin [Salinicoccus sp. YB14-2]|nr:type I toxin-antitoxin system Fst family toxin [Salinicoccus sp. YB14-2]